MSAGTARSTSPTYAFWRLTWVTLKSRVADAAVLRPRHGRGTRNLGTGPPDGPAQVIGGFAVRTAQIHNHRQRLSALSRCGVLAFKHVGSTSVPDLPAKP